MSYLSYVKKKRDVHEVQFLKYHKYWNERKIVDISTLSPCQSVLLLHSNRANYVACVWKRSLGASLNYQVYQIMDGMKMRTYAGLNSPSEKV